MFQKILKAILFLALFGNAAVSLAGDPAGTWSSSSGSTIKIWANMQTVRVTVITPQGQSNTYEGWWTRFSDYFSYNGPSGTFNASFSGSNKIRVQGPKGESYVWQRGGKSSTLAPRAASRKVDISGMWKSTSGSSVQVSSQGKQVYVTLVDRKGKRFSGSGRWLSKSSFDYSIPGYPNVANCQVQSNDQISVVYGNTNTTWYRQ